MIALLIEADPRNIKRSAPSFLGTGLHRIVVHGEANIAVHRNGAIIEGDILGPCVIEVELISAESKTVSVYAERIDAGRSDASIRIA